MDKISCNKLTENGLPRQKSVYNSSSGTLHSLSMSNVFSIILISLQGLFWTPTGLNKNIIIIILILRALENIFLSPTDLNKLFISMIITIQKGIWRLCLWHGEENYYDRSHLKSSDVNLLFSVRETVFIFISKVDELSTMNLITGGIVDTSNFHRLLLLVFHTLPSHGHARHISEITLDSFHQVLKRSMKDRTSSDK